jgi:hypothetical protein
MCCGFVGDIVGGVVDVIGSVAEFVVENALPIIETVALTYALGPAGLGMSQLSATVVSRVAVTALNGGSIGSIVAAGLTPMLPDIAKGLGLPSDLVSGSFITKPIADALGNTELANIVASAAGSAVTGGAIAAVTGGDVLQAAAMAGLSPIVAQGMAKTWSAIKEYMPSLETKQNELTTLQQNIDANKSTLEGLNRFQDTINQNAEIINSDPQYTKLRDTYKLYNEAKDAGNTSAANSYARQVNDLSADLQKNNYVYNTLVPTYNSQVESFNGLVSQNQGLLDQVMKSYDLQNQIGTLSTQIQADYTNYQLSDALSKGDWSSATKYFTDLNNYNNALVSYDPKAITVAPDLSTSQVDLLKQMSSATDDTVKNQLYSQATQAFADINAPSTTPNTPTAPTTGTTTGTGTTVNPYDQLPKLPDTGIPTTPTTPTGITPTTPTTPTTPPSAIGTLGNNLVNAFGNAIKGGVVSNLTGQVINAITGQPTQNQPTQKPTVKVPPKKVDVSTLRPFTGQLPAQLAGTTTPTGGLGQTTNTTQTPTQTGNSGLPSTTQPKTPAQKVDVSTLKPVTDVNWLKSIGLVQG